MNPLRIAAPSLVGLALLTGCSADPVTTTTAPGDSDPAPASMSAEDTFKAWVKGAYGGDPTTACEHQSDAYTKQVINANDMSTDISCVDAMKRIGKSLEKADIKASDIGIEVEVEGGQASVTINHKGDLKDYKMVSRDGRWLVDHFGSWYEKDDDGILEFGETAVFKSGLSMTIESLGAFKTNHPDSVPPGGVALAYEVTIKNGTSEPFKPIGFSASAISGETEAERIFDSGAGVNGEPTGVLLPGKTVKFKIGFGVADAKDVVMEAAPGYEFGSVYYQTK